MGGTSGSLPAILPVWLLFGAALNFGLYVQVVNGHRSYAHDSPGRACSAALGFLLQCDVCVCLLAQVHESTAQQGNEAIAHHLNMSSTNLELRIDILQGACVRIHGSKRKASMSHPNLMQRGM